MYGRHKGRYRVGLERVGRVVAQTALRLCGYMMRDLARCNTAVMAHRAIIRIYVNMVIGDPRESREINQRMTG